MVVAVPVVVAAVDDGVEDDFDGEDDCCLTTILFYTWNLFLNIWYICK